MVLKRKPRKHSEGNKARETEGTKVAKRRIILSFIEQAVFIPNLAADFALAP